MLKRTLLVAAVVSLAAAPAFAGSCPKHMKAIDEALAGSPQLTEQQMKEVKQLRAEGEKLHKEGKHAESVATLSQAEKILGVKQ